MGKPIIADEGGGKVYGGRLQGIEFLKGGQGPNQVFPRSKVFHLIPEAQAMRQIGRPSAVKGSLARGMFCDGKHPTPTLLL